MTFVLGFLSAILMICIFSAIVHSLRWIEDVFQGTIHAVEVETDDYSAPKDAFREALDRLAVQRAKLREAIKNFEDFEKTYRKK